MRAEFSRFGFVFRCFSVLLCVVALSAFGCSDKQSTIIEADDSTEVPEDYEAMSYGDSYQNEQ